MTIFPIPAIWILLTMSIAPYKDCPVDILELNHVHDAQARCTLSQYIGWRVLDDGTEVVDWWCHAGPVVRRVGGEYRVDLIRGNSWWRVRSPVYRKTWTHHDREVENRSVWPVEMRRGM